MGLSEQRGTAQIKLFDPQSPGMEQVYSKEHTFSCWADHWVDLELGGICFDSK